MNENNYSKLEQLRKELDEAKLKKEQTEHQLTRQQNRLEYRENFSRKERTHRLIILGAVMEQYFPELKGKSEAELAGIFNLLDVDGVRKLFNNAMSDSGKKVNV